MTRFPTVAKRLLNTCVRLRRDSGGGIAPIAAVVSTVLLLSAGMGVDVGRELQLSSALQDAADAAALAGITQSTSAQAQSSAQAYVNAAVAQIPFAPAVTIVTNNYDTSDSTNPKMTVTLKASTPTTMLAFARVSLPAMATATASGSLVRKVTVSVSNFNSSAADQNNIYWYSYANTLSGNSLYNYVPTLSSSQILLSNNSSVATSPNSFTVPLNSSVGFALANKTGGIHGYGSNCYGVQQGATTTYYSHRESSAGYYYDYPSTAFTLCKNTRYTNGTAYACSTDCNVSAGISVPSGNYIYALGYSRNPLKFTTTNTDCSKGTVGYAWDDNGGQGNDDDDNDDARFSVSCTEVAVSKGSIRLVS